jgi:ectoine hydroxylase-related dioxygenase (phytanoyl-CoA dioxygenase family)
VQGFHVPSSSPTAMKNRWMMQTATTTTMTTTSSFWSLTPSQQRPKTTPSIGKNSAVVAISSTTPAIPTASTTQLYFSALSSSSSSFGQQEQQHDTCDNNEKSVDSNENIPPSSTIDNNNNNNHHNTKTKCRFMYMTEEEDRLLKEKGDLEESSMNTPTPIEVPSIKKVVRSSSSSGFGGGFGTGTAKSGGGKDNNRTSKKSGKIAIASAADGTETTTTTKNNSNSNIDTTTIQALVKVLEIDGLIRIDHVMDEAVADTLRDYLIDLRARATQAVEDGTISDSQQRFADVLLNRNRCDLKVPLGPSPVNTAVLDVLQKNGYPSRVRSVIEGVFDSYGGNGKYASLWELNCFMSTAGARRQLIHADNVCLDPVQGLHDNCDDNDVGKEPILLTCFIALQDIDSTMGPTIFMPGTHTIDAHNRFFETNRDVASTRTDTYSPKNTLLSSSKAVMGAPIPKGSCIIFDPRVLHCAGENCCYSDPQKTRALFYMSFKNPKIDNPGCPSTSGYGISTAELTIDELVSDLTVNQRGLPTKRLGLLASSP